MQGDLLEHFQAFELLDDDEPMRGFKRVVRCVLRDFGTIMDHPDFSFEKPLDVRFAKSMVKTTSHVLGTDTDVLFGFAEYAEFSLLLGSVDEEEGGGRGLLSRIASNAAGKLSLLLGDLALFDVHLYQFPSPELAKAYFVWRQRAFQRLALDRYLRHVFSAADEDHDRAEMIIADFGEEEKIEILAQHEVDFESLPGWQRTGAGIYWQAGVEDEEPALMVDTSLPGGQEYSEYLDMFM